MSGRKRHLLVDTEGLLLKAYVHPADEPDGIGARPLLAALQGLLPRLEVIWVDGGYKRAFADWVAATLGWRVEVVQHPDAGLRYVWVAPGETPPARPAGFRVLPRRWVVERTFAWLGRHRRLSKDYEALAATEEAWIYLAMSRVMTVRLARTQEIGGCPARSPSCRTSGSRTSRASTGPAPIRLAAGTGT